MKFLPMCIALLMLGSAASAQEPSAEAPAKKPEPEKTTAEKDPNPHALIKTSMGDIEVELFADAAPKTVANFLGLAEGTKEFTDPKTGKKVKRPYYDGLTFHRVIKNFMLQGGCPLGTGTGGPGYKFKDEINAESLGLDKIKAFDKEGRPHDWLGIRSQAQFHQRILRPVLKEMGIENQEQLDKRNDEVKAKLKTLSLADCYRIMGYEFEDDLKSRKPVKGSLAMANAGPNTNGSQFFINHADTPWLTGKHTVFGKVVSGMDVVDKIANVKVGPGSAPAEEVKILSIRRVDEDADKDKNASSKANSEEKADGK